MPKSRYITLMEKILSAYTNEHIDQYYNEVKTNGLHILRVEFLFQNSVIVLQSLCVCPSGPTGPTSQTKPLKESYLE